MINYYTKQLIRCEERADEHTANARLYEKKATETMLNGSSADAMEHYDTSVRYADRADFARKEADNYRTAINQLKQATKA